MTAAPTTWLNKRERGTIAGIRAVFVLATLFGRWPARLLVRVIALYYALFDKKAVRASKEWFTVVHGRPARWRDAYRHILRFSQMTLDRLFLLRGKTRPFRFTHTGHELLERHAKERTGAILVGAHLGSYEAMRAGGEGTRLPLNIVGYFANARLINALFEKLNPSLAARVIHIGDGSIDFIFQIKERIAAGEMVALLADRAGLNENTTTVPFFGRPARFATGPFILASLLNCPVYLTFGLYTEPNRYDLYCEPFAERLVLPRKDRQRALEAEVLRYAQRLEHYCRKAPDNWSNFFDFWSLQVP